MASYFASIIAAATGFKVVLFLLILLAVAVWMLLKELKEKEELQRLLNRAIEGKSISPKDIHKVETQLNQVYLKGENK